MMRLTVFTLAMLLAFPLALPANAADFLPGRYQALVMGQGTRVFILDTKDGHSWGYDLNDNQLRYYGQVRPGAEPGEVLAATEGMTMEERLENLKVELKEEIQALKQAMAQPGEGVEGGIDSRTDLQKAIARTNLRREIKEEIKEAIEEQDIEQEIKTQLKQIIDRLN